MASFSIVQPCIFTPFLSVVESSRNYERVDEEYREPAPDPAQVAAAAWDDGFQRGYSEGMALAQREQRRIIRRLGRVSQRARLDAEDFTRAIERQAVHLAIAIAEKVISREVQVDEEIVLAVLHGALEELRHATLVQVRVHPADRDLIEQHWTTLVGRSGPNAPQLVEDTRVHRGGCVIETVNGLADAQLETKVAQIKQTLESVLDGEPE